MWQEITVGLVVAAAAIFAATRLRKNFKSLKGDRAPACGGCSSCGQEAKAADCGASTGTCDPK